MMRIVNNRRKCRKKGRQSTVLRQYFMTYLLVLSIPMLICCLYYIRMLSFINEDDIRSRQTELEHAAVLVDTILDEFEYLGNSLIANAEVNSFKNTEDVLYYPNTYKVYELRDSLPDLYQINQSVFDYFIFFDKSETVINKRIAYNYEEFYRLYLHEEKYKSFEEWYENIINDKGVYGITPMETYFYKEKESVSLMAYVRPMMGLPGGNSGRIYIYLEDKKMEMLMPAPVENGIQYIENDKGDIIYFQGARAEVISALKESGEIAGQGRSRQEVWSEGKQYLMISHASDKSGLIYHMLLPKNVVNNRMVSSIMVLSLFILLGVAVGTLLSYHMSIKSATPINDILREVSQITESFEGHQSVFSSLKTTFKYLVADNSRLADAIESQKPYIRNAFINRLIYGSFVTEAEAAKIAEDIGYPFRDRVFCIIILRFNLLTESMQETGLKLMSSCVFSLLEVIGNILPDSLYTNLGNEQVALLLSVPDQEKENFRQEAERLILRIKEAMPSNISEKLFAYGGSQVDSLGQICESFHNAAYMYCNEHDQLENAVIWHHAVSGSIPGYPPQDLSVKLAHYVTAGDGKGLHDALEDTLKTYIIENNLPIYLQHMLLNELQIILFRIIRRIGMEEAEYRKYYESLEDSHNAPLVTQLSVTLNLYNQVCDYVRDQKMLQDSQVAASAIVAYIDTNFGDANLCLAGVADLFHISEPYLSSIFKQTQGINFSTYVEVVRIDKAKDFLKTTSLSIGEIAGLVGYGSANSFCRAFKRVTGLSASEYRKK